MAAFNECPQFCVEAIGRQKREQLREALENKDMMSDDEDVVNKENQITHFHVATPFWRSKEVSLINTTRMKNRPFT